MISREEFDQLAPFEDHFHKAVFSDFLRYPGRAGVALMDSVLSRAEKRQIATDSSCGHCVFATLKRLGRLYFDFKQSDGKLPAKR